MIHTIPLHRVLEHAVGAGFSNLVTRPTGAAVRSGIQHEMSQANCPTTLLDFSSVGLMDFSCADEVVAKLLQWCEPDAERYVLLHGLSENHWETIDHILANHRLAVAAVTPAGGVPQLLGQVSSDERAVFARIHEDGPADAGSLASELAWPIERAALALQSLTTLRLLRADGGRYHPVPCP